MIGLINNVVEAFVTDTFGPETWKQVLQNSGHEDSYPWVSTCPLMDKITYDLVITASGMLGITVAQALEAFGVYFVKFVQASGFTKLLTALGGDIVKVLDNLNNLHTHLSFVYPEMHAPDFRCTNMTPESVELHYYSHRPLLGPLVVGILKGMAKDFFLFELEIDILQSRDDGADHEVFLLKFPPQESIRDRIEACEIPRSPASPSPFGLSPRLFADLHPYHVVMDRNFTVLQHGSMLVQLLGSRLKVGCHVAECFKIKRPMLQGFNWKDIERHSNGPFLLTTTSSGLTIKGQMLFTNLKIPGCPASTEVIVFMGSPYCSGLDEFQRHKLRLSDIPTHKMVMDYVLLSEDRLKEAELMTEMEILKNELEMEQLRTKAVIARMANLLALLPSGIKEDTSPLLEGQGRSTTPVTRMSLHHSAIRSTQPGGAQAARLSLESRESHTGVTCTSRSQATQGITGRRSVDVRASTSGIHGSSSKVSYGAQERMSVIAAVTRAMKGDNQGTSNLDSELTLVRPIGEGAHGKVYYGLWQGVIVAVKTMVLSGNMAGADKREKLAIREAGISASLSHPNVVQTYSYSVKKQEQGGEDEDEDAVQQVVGESDQAPHSATEYSPTGAAQDEAFAEGRKKSVGPVISFSSGIAPSHDVREMLAAHESANGSQVIPEEAPFHNRPVCDLNHAWTSKLSRALPEKHSAEKEDDFDAKHTSAPSPSPPVAPCLSSPAPVAPRHRTLANLDESKLVSRSSGGSSAATTAPFTGTLVINLVLEYCDLGSLRLALDEGRFNNPDGTVKYKDVIETASEVARALIYVHRQRVLHGDVKAHNVLLSTSHDAKGFTTKLSDFGLSVHLEKEDTCVMGWSVGTPTHMAPELHLEGRMSKASDVYAYGILLWELYTQGRPFNNVPKALLGHQVAVEGVRPQFPPDTPKDYKSLAEWCWCKNADSRPIMEEVLMQLNKARRSLAIQKSGKLKLAGGAGEHVHSVLAED